jgi:septation ring formation regulator EzrA
MFADYTPPVGFAAWIACAAFALWFLLLTDKAIRRVRGNEPHPPNPQLGQSIEDLNRRVQEIEDWRKKFVDKLERDKGEILEAGEQRATRIHEHIENDRRELDGKIDALPDRVITILKNTGALRR